jgi:hypothetical protein
VEYAVVAEMLAESPQITMDKRLLGQQQHQRYLRKRSIYLNIRQKQKMEPMARTLKNFLITRDLGDYLKLLSTPLNLS